MNKDLELFNDEIVQKTMTTKEVARVCKVDERTIRNTVQKLRNVLSVVQKNNQGGYLFTERQATLIKQEIAKHHNLASRQIDSVSTEMEEFQKMQEGYAIAVRLANRYKQKAEMERQAKEKLQIQFDENKQWRSIKWMEKQTGEHYRYQELKKASKDLGIEPKKVFDQNYGEVNAYHIDAWQRAYGDGVVDVIEEV